MRSNCAIKNAFSAILLQIVAIICGFIIPKLMISTYGSEMNGLISSIAQFLSYISLIDSGFGTVVMAALYKPIANNDEQKIKNILYVSNSFFRKIALIFIIYIILLCIFYPIFFAKGFDFILTISLIVIISFSTFAEYFFGMTYMLYLKAKQKSYIISLLSILRAIVNTLLVFVMVKFNFGILSVKLISSLILLIQPIILNIYVKKHYKFNFKNVDKNYRINEKWDALLQHIAFVINRSTDITVLTVFSSLINVSIYSVYNLVVKGIDGFIFAINNGLDSTFGDIIAKNEYDVLKKRFSLYETIYYSFLSFVFICTLYLINPFIEIYTSNITDANYHQPLFGYILVLGELVYAVRYPFRNVIYSAGKYKDISLGSVIEALTNIILSVILVVNYGLIGVALATMIAMFIRTIEFAVYGSKKIIKISILDFVKRMIILLMSIIISLFILSFVKFEINDVVVLFFINCICCVIVSCIIVLITNFIFFKDDIKSFITIIKSNFRRNV